VFISSTFSISVNLYSGYEYIVVLSIFDFSILPGIGIASLLFLQINLTTFPFAISLTEKFFSFCSSKDSLSRVKRKSEIEALNEIFFLKLSRFHYLHI